MPYIDSCLKSLYNGHLCTTATFFSTQGVNVWIFCPPGQKKVAVVLREVAVSGGSTVVFFFNVKILSARVFCNYR